MQKIKDYDNNELSKEKESYKVINKNVKNKEQPSIVRSLCALSRYIIQRMMIVLIISTLICYMINSTMLSMNYMASTILQRDDGADLLSSSSNGLNISKGITSGRDTESSSNNASLCFLDGGSNPPPSTTYDDDGNIISTGSCAATDNELMQSPPCPIKGRCRNGVLIDCLDGYEDKDENVEVSLPINEEGSLPTYQHQLYQISDSGEECILIPAANRTTIYLRQLIEDVTKFDICRQNLWFFWSSIGSSISESCDGDDSIIGGIKRGSSSFLYNHLWRLKEASSINEKQGKGQNKIVTTTYFSLNSIANYTELDINVLLILVKEMIERDDTIVLNEIGPDNDNENNNASSKSISSTTSSSIAYLALDPTYVQYEIKLPFKCWVLIGLQSIILITIQLVWKFLLNFLKLILHAAMGRPLPALTITIFIYILFWIRKRRAVRAELRRKTIAIRNVVYERLVRDQIVARSNSDDGNGGFAVLHLRDEIARENFPLSGKGRTEMMNKVWPLVVSEIRTDNRVKKSRRNVGDKKLEWWEWVASSSSFGSLVE